MRIPMRTQEIHDMTATTVDVVSTSSSTETHLLLYYIKQICLDSNFFQVL